MRYHVSLGACENGFRYSAPPSSLSHRIARPTRSIRERNRMAPRRGSFVRAPAREGAALHSSGVSETATLSAAPALPAPTAIVPTPPGPAPSARAAVSGPRTKEGAGRVTSSGAAPRTGSRLGTPWGYDAAAVAPSRGPVAGAPGFAGDRDATAPGFIALASSIPAAGRSRLRVWKNAPAIRPKTMRLGAEVGGPPGEGIT